jgi:cyclic pyranopterin phosphate synthase
MNSDVTTGNPDHPVIPIVDRRGRPEPIDIAPHVVADRGLRDTRGRPLHDLRISVTDRCNFRCTYCMPKDVFDRDHRFLPHADLLTFEEIERLARAFVTLGVEKVRLTGGEPLLRKNIEQLIAMLSKIEVPPSDGTGLPRPLDLTLTTNGSLLRRKARALKAAGLKRLTVSLDALDDARFRAMNDVDFPVADVLDGIDAAAEAGLGPVKVNMVVKRGVNDDQIEAMARRFRGTGHILRFIEFMDVGASNGWKLGEVVPSAELAARIDAIQPIEAIAPNYAGEVAERWRYRDGSGEIGFISSVTQAFCGACSRARISPEGSLYTCLFASHGANLRQWVRSTPSDALLTRAIASVWSARADRYSEIRGISATFGSERIEMSYIGG